MPLGWGMGKKRTVAEWAAAVWLAIGGALPAHAIEAELSLLDLRAVDAPIPTLAVDGAEDRALRYAKTIQRALAFFRTELGWSVDFKLAVLDRPAWEKASGVPWPAPFVQPSEAYIVMPASIVDYPGFDQWSFDDQALTEVLTVHEVGHALASANGLESANHWVHELIADLFLAAFVREKERAMMPLLAGPPEGFGPFKHTQFADLDYLYSGVGLLNYAWYQFELARLANRMLDEKPFRDIALELKGSLDGQVRLLAPASAEAVSAVTPGVGPELARFIGESSLARIEAMACSDALRNSSGENSAIFVENASSRPLDVIDWVSHETRQSTLDGIADLAGTPKETLPVQPVTVHPGTVAPLFAYAGQELDLGGGRCIKALGHPVRYRVE